MAQLECTECGEEVFVDTRNLGPHGAIALAAPLKAICDDCIVAKKLTIEGEDGGNVWLRLRGKEYRLVGGAFTRSEHPRVVGSYYRDQQQ